MIQKFEQYLNDCGHVDIYNVMECNGFKIFSILPEEGQLHKSKLIREIEINFHSVTIIEGLLVVILPIVYTGNIIRNE